MVVRRLMRLGLLAAADAVLLRSTAARRKLGTEGRPRIRVIAEVLNALGIHTARGGAWHDSTARNLLAPG
jgi:hypothetical protein